jgi:metal-responsive CopG/Arc/MetJ family transcriptional regulator
VAERQVVAVRLDDELIRRLDMLQLDLGARSRSDAITWCVVAALNDKHRLFGGVIRLHAEAMVAAMKADGNGGGRR